jgi:hypothetical protein
MIGQGIAKGAFLTISAALAAALALAVYQVPQPWRSGVIVWLLVGAPLLFFVLRVLRHATQIKLAGARPDAPPRALSPAEPARPRRRLDNLHIVVSDSAGSGRFTLR